MDQGSWEEQSIYSNDNLFLETAEHSRFTNKAKKFFPRCLAHFPPGDTYESMVDIDDVRYTSYDVKIFDVEFDVWACMSTFII